MYIDRGDLGNPLKLYTEWSRAYSGLRKFRRNMILFGEIFLLTNDTLPI